jgi:hypothetical protein
MIKVNIKSLTNILGLEVVLAYNVRSKSNERWGGSSGSENAVRLLFGRLLARNQATRAVEKRRDLDLIASSS